MRRKLELYRNIDADIVSELLSAIGVGMDESRKEALVARMRSRAAEQAVCDQDTHLAAAAAAGLLYGLLRLGESPLTELAEKRLTRIAALLGELGCLERVAEKIGRNARVRRERATP